MDAKCWQILAIAPTSDARVIKQAYAALLQNNKPDQNPAGFIALRQAYEQALAERVFYEENLEDLENSENLENLEDLEDAAKVNDTTEVDEFFSADDANNRDLDDALNEANSHASDISKSDTPAALVTSPPLFNESYEPLSQLEIWQYAWQQCATLPDADQQLYQTLQKQLAQRQQLSLDEAFAFEESLLAWHFEHATDYPLSFEYCAQTLNWRQQASQIQSGATFSDNWYDLYWLIDDYDSHNRAAFLQRRNQHIETSRILASWENNWRISLINDSLLRRLEEDYDYAQGFDSLAQAYLSQTLLIWFHDQAELHVDAFEFAYQVFYWKYRLNAPDCYQFPWSYLPRLLERYQPQIALKNSLKITDIDSFQRHVQQRYPHLFNRWFFDPHSPKPTIVITNPATTGITHQSTLQPAKPSRWQLWAWRWQFIWAFKFAFNLHPITEQLQAVEAIIDSCEAGLADIAHIESNNSALNAAEPSENQRSDIYHYWHGSVKLQQLYTWSSQGFVRPSLKLFISLVIVALALVVSISYLFTDALWQWQHVAIDALVLTIIFGFALIFWQWQLTLFADIQRFFEGKQRLARYGVWVGMLWLIIMLLPGSLIIGTDIATLSGVIDGQQPLPSFGQLALFVARHILGLLSIILLAYRTADVHSMIAVWYASILSILMIALNILAWVTQAQDVLLFALSPWIWAVFALPVMLKIQARYHPDKTSLPTWAEVMMFLLMAGVLYVMLFSFYLITVLLPPQQLVISAGILIILLIFWSLSLLNTWVYCSNQADYLTAISLKVKK